MFKLTPLLIALASLPVAARAAEPPPMHNVIEQRLLPDLDRLFQKIITEKRDTTLDGVRVFTGEDKFLPGKVAIGVAHLILHTSDGDPRRDAYLAGFRQIADMTIDDPNDTWGIYYYVLALQKLNAAGLLDRAVAPATLQKLRTNLDWRRFVRADDFTLIDLPNNYYGVSFGIARQRALLGWEDYSGSETLLRKAFDHYRKYSGQYGFADETDGEGRFDRYSILLAGEIAQRMLESGMTPPDEVKTWLRKSVDLLLPRFNQQGTGFEYGRSIGVYGETAFLEVFAVAAKLGVLTVEERDMAYAFASRITQRYATFWYDPEIASVNMWSRGRRTDAYRGRKRILGENLSLSHQYIYTEESWNELGYRGRTPSKAFTQWLRTLPRYRVTWFQRGTYDRLVVTVRDRGHVIGLPLINGGPEQHRNSPYYPVPFATGMLQAIADGRVPLLIPRFTLMDGSELLPVAFMQDVKVEQRGDTMTVTYRQPVLDRANDLTPSEDKRIEVRTTYRFEPGKITRDDEYRAPQPLQVANVRLEFANYAAGGRLDGKVIRFAHGDVQSLQVSGAGACRVEDSSNDPLFRAPDGQFNSRAICETGSWSFSGTHKVRWVLTYR
ncbi:hypothetical protein [Roseiterribacter gracilis]|uniref:Uncharacterized protein n=1 Tax=Roseiterribacter gracilis TaxID=2812848 RepID=A0A8S8X6D0_9PROT|nr:hypothetical protein TMPK1_09050 [Rhodospirillales bacterium TMPK1]